ARQRLKRRTSEAADILPLHAAEEEELVFDDRAAEAEAEVVVAQRRTRHPARVVEEVVGVELVIAQELKGAAVELVIAAAGHDVDRRAGIAPVLRREIGGLDVDLADEVNAYVVDLAAIAARIGIEAAVHRQQVLVAAGAVDRL